MMKRLVLAILALAAIFALGKDLKAEVQNVRLGGDIRTRFYYTKNLYDLSSDGEDDDFYIRQLSRVSAEADLTDNVWAVATVEADGVWGQSVARKEVEVVDVNGVPKTLSRWVKEDNVWDVDIAEAYLQISEVFYSPLTFKFGRQYLQYGRGFLISSRDWRYKFDAVRGILDFFPWTIDLLYSRLTESDEIATGGWGKAADDEDLFGVNFNYQEDLWSLEGYVFGIRDAINDEELVTLGEPKDAPVTVGLRADASPVEALDLWGEFSYQLGSYQAPGMEDAADIRAFGFDLGMVYVFDVTWEPAIALSYTFGSGDDGSDLDQVKSFNPLFNNTYYGYAYEPRLSNIGIVNGQLSMVPSEDFTLILDLFLYMQSEEAAMAMGDPGKDKGGVMWPTNGDDKDLGMELDAIAEYDYSEDFSTQLVFAWFKPGDAYKDEVLNPDPDDVFEIRAELLVSF
jgi:hypothetical protein